VTLLRNESRHPLNLICIVSCLASLLFSGTGMARDNDLSLDRLQLTPAEISWIKTHETVRIGGPRAFPPFHYYDDDQSKPKGISADYLFTIMDQLGIQVSTAPAIPWNQVLEMVKSGEIDLIPCTAKAEDRKAYLNFTHPYLSFPLVILSRKDAPFIGGIQDLHGKTLATVNKNVTQTWLQRDGIEYTRYPVASPRKRLEAISLGRADAGIENLAAASYIIQNFGLTNIKIAAPTPYGNYNLYMGVRKDLPELQSIINKVLERTTPEQHMQIRNKWLSVRYEHGLRPADIIKWILVVVCIAAIIIGVVLLANNKLKKEVSARVKLIGELEAALAEIKTLEGIVPICSNCKNIRDDKGYWNRLEAYIEKHSDASFSHSMCPDCTEKLYGKEEWYKKKKRAQK